MGEKHTPQGEWTDRFAAVLLPLGWDADVAAIEAAASWEDEAQRTLSPERAAAEMLTHLPEYGE